MIFSRRCPRAMEPAACRPDPSGPRGAIAAVMRATASTSGPPAPWSANRISPAMPHMGVLRSSFPRVDKAAAGHRNPLRVSNM
jgi:hypothetical protein